MLRPKSLHEDLASVQAAGIGTVISLLEPQEAASLGLSAQGEACAALGLTFLNHTIRDMHLPRTEAFTGFAAGVADDIRAGAHVAVHCRASIGRTGMLACAILGHFGYSADAAITHVSAQRGVQVPDTAAQATFIRKIIAARA